MGRTTIIKKRICGALLLAILASDISATAAICSPEERAAVARQLGDYLKNPTSAATAALATKLCLSSPHGSQPCPLTTGEARVADLDKASTSNPGVIAALACAWANTEGASVEAINELQARLLDRLGSKFFTAWLTIPKKVKPFSQKIDNFITSTGDASLGPSSKLELFESRLAVLENAQKVPGTLGLAKELGSAVDLLKTQIRNLRSETLLAQPSESDSDMVLTRSKFFDLLTEKVTKLAAGDFNHVTLLANQLLSDVGLDYRFYFKNGSRDWNLCSTSSATSSECKNTTVGVVSGSDSCGKFGLAGIMMQSGATWIVSTKATHFRVNSSEYFNPVMVALQRSGTTDQKWNLPEGFTPRYVTADLKDLLVSTQIKTTAGTKLGELFLLIQANSLVRFVDAPKDLKNFIVLSGKPIQHEQDLYGAPVAILSPAPCY